jgi:TRAP-type C4-dicarboxylate transport system permease small subunit
VIKIQRAFLCVIGIVMVLLLSADGLGRYILGKSITWAEELTRVFFVWGCFISITIAFIKKSHIGFDSVAKINSITKKVSDIVNGLCLAIIGATVMYFGILFINQVGRFPLPATGFPIVVLYIAGVFAGISWICIGLYQLIASLKPSQLKGEQE